MLRYLIKQFPGLDLFHGIAKGQSGYQIVNLTEPRVFLLCAVVLLKQFFFALLRYRPIEENGNFAYQTARLEGAD